MILRMYPKINIVFLMTQEIYFSGKLINKKRSDIRYLTVSPKITIKNL